MLRPVYFVHWEDSAVIECLERYDGVFLLPALSSVPPNVIDRLRNCGKPVVVLSKDWSEYGFISIMPRPVESLSTLLEHLGRIGHRRIDCFNTQPLDDEIKRSVDYWRGWLAGRNFTGELYNWPVESYGDSLEQAYVYVKKLIESKNWDSTAVFCMTLSAAIGMMRAMADCGLQPGVDTAVCTINGVGFAKYLCPSLTSLQEVSFDPFVARTVSWLLAGGKKDDWDGPFLLCPSESHLFIGESTVGNYRYKQKINEKGI